MNRRLAFVWAVSAGAAALGWLFFRAGYPGVIYDSFHYYVLSSIVSVEGLWNLSSRVRMYGYPLFVAAATGFSDPPPEAARALVATVQLAVYLAAALYFARVTERVFRRPRVFEGTYALLALNPIALIRATELMSDSLSAVLVGLALFASLEEGGRNAEPSWRFSPRAPRSPCGRRISWFSRRWPCSGSCARGSTASVWPEVSLSERSRRGSRSRRSCTGT